ncbi:PREDICTED: sugar transporter SWEET1 isoform X1 [Miniopterus natalensis]|uniref:sugar transporter SWEET1 isoform X1 n=1 Tax=Miniopterus natalensis TaxID=291302 RepID=UPI0007A6EDE8|nr:PREDICTED: sugar transporter SWEET1 isoform X1 [Miniopterus natalensis]
MSSSCPFSPRMSSERDDSCSGKDCLRGGWDGVRTVEEAPRVPSHIQPRGKCPSPPSYSNLSWLSYGALKGDGTLIVVNAVGAVLQTIYILVYLHYCPRKGTVLLQTATLLGVLLLGFGYFWLLVPNIEARLQQLGLFCSVFTISMYLSPLTDLAKVIQTKSTQRLSFSLTIATLLTSASWTLYGFQLRDPYIMVPNLPGILTSFIRLWLFWKYPQEQDRNYQLLQT